MSYHNELSTQASYQVKNHGTSVAQLIVTYFIHCLELCGFFLSFTKKFWIF